MDYGRGVESRAVLNTGASQRRTMEGVYTCFFSLTVATLTGKLSILVHMLGLYRPLR